MYLNIHTHRLLKNSEFINVLNLDKGNKALETYFSTGVHPWYVSEVDLEFMYKKVSENLSLSQAIFLGECGLDKAIDTPLELQKKVFIAQLDINKSFGKPVVLHCVRAYEEVLGIIKSYDFSFIFHGFNKNVVLAKQLLAKSYYLSFGAALLNSEKVQEAFKEIPLQNIFLETDDADISIEILYLKAAELRQISIEKLALGIMANYKKIRKQ